MPAPAGPAAPAAANHNGNQLLAGLVLDPGAAGVFGICYSVLTWGGVGKGLGLSPRSWLKTAGKMFENGHATTFLIDLAGNELTMTGIDTNAWVFDSDTLANQDWARPTASATTYVYYICINQARINAYSRVRRQLLREQTSYAVLWPNMWPATTHYQNCVSHSHYLMWKLGLASWGGTKGWWMPSVSNWAEWFKSFVPTARNGFSWKYQVFQNTNTHIP